MEQAKKRDHKIEITETAIQKIPVFNSREYTDKQLHKINSKHAELLQRAKAFNNSNETAVLFDLYSDEEAWMYGTENAVNIFRNPAAVSMANQRGCLFLAHNHPSTQNFSYSDLGVFLMNDNIIGMSVVTNMGNLHVLTKTRAHMITGAYDLLWSIRQKYGKIDDETDGKVVREFLRSAKSTGIIYT